MEHLDLSGKIILKWIFNKLDEVIDWIDLASITAGGGLLQMR